MSFVGLKSARGCVFVLAMQGSTIWIVGLFSVRPTRLPAPVRPSPLLKDFSTLPLLLHAAQFFLDPVLQLRCNLARSWISRCVRPANRVSWYPQEGLRPLMQRTGHISPKRVDHGVIDKNIPLPLGGISADCEVESRCLLKPIALATLGIAHFLLPFPSIFLFQPVSCSPAVS